MPVHAAGSFPRRQPQTEYSEPRGDGRSSSVRSSLANGARISHYRVLKNLPRTEDALALLRRVGAEVKGIMRKHGWHLPLLTEFSGFSKSPPDLLGMNRNSGQTIFLRLRYPSSERTLTDSFLPFEDIIGTMLHELAHNKRGPHDEIFYEVLSGLEEEWYEMKRNGGWMAGDGFDSHGQTLGSLEGLGPSNVPFRRLPQTAADKADMRRRHEELSRGGPRQLGGLATTGNEHLASLRRAGATPAELAAQAADIRKKSESSCPSTQTEREGAVKWYEEEDLVLGVKVIAIEEDSDTEEEIQSSTPRPEENADDSVEVTHTKKAAIHKTPKEAITIDSSSDEEAVDHGRKTNANVSQQDSQQSDDIEVVSEVIKKRPPTALAKSKPTTSSTTDRKKGYLSMAAGNGARSTGIPSLARRKSDSPPPRTRLRGELNISGRVAEEALKSMRSRRTQPVPQMNHTPPSDIWTCQACTLTNAGALSFCEACSAPRPGLRQSLADQMWTLQQDVQPGNGSKNVLLSDKAWRCSSCGYFMDGEKADLWCCSSCGSLARK
ncbi:unnamed protein product [Sympodiomycopsis kandeliae]